MNSTTKRLTLARACAVSSLLAFVAPALAQQEPTTTAQTKERIEVTGSNIKRVEGETALPVTVLRREDIEKTGATNAIDLIQRISSNASAGSVLTTATIGATTFSAQTANLRGLTGGRTLVLINGKRVNGFAGEVNGVQGVNLAVIPFSAIERVEVLKDGASAIYGSDAIAGVINFILRSDYRGAEVAVHAEMPTRSGGGKEEKYSGTFGFGDLSRDRYNVFVSASFENQHNLLQKDRNFSNTAYIPSIGYNTLSSNSFPGNITTGNIGIPGGVQNCNTPYGSFYPDLSPNRCFFDPAGAPGVQSIPDVKDSNLFGQVKFQISNDWQAYGTALYSKSENNFVIQPVPISNLFFYGPNGDIPATVELPPSSPFYPHAAAIAAGVDGQPLNVRYRSILSGNRDTTDTNEGMQFVAGVKGSAWNWDTDFAYNYSEGKVKEVLNGGFPLYSRILPLLNGGTVNLFGPNTPAIEQQVAAANFNGETFNGKATTQSFQASGSREVWQLPAGPMAIALGGEYRKEKLDQNYNPVLRTGDVSGYGGTFDDVHATRNDTAFYAELSVPILKQLEATVAIRTDNYSDFGRTNNPKATLRYQPTRDLLFRASYGRGFLAPSLFQLFVPQTNTVSPPGVSDPIRCPVTHDTGLDCNTQFTIVNGGNPNLQPEKSSNTTFGIVWEPTRSFSIGADYFEIWLKDVIVAGIPFTTILGDLNQFGNLVTRGPTTPDFPGLPGRITAINQTFINLGKLHIQGVDGEAHYTFPRTSYGRVRFDINGTYYIRNDAQNIDGSYSGFVSNQFGSLVPGVVPRWKHYAVLSWDSGPWAASIAQSYQSGYVDVNVDNDGNTRRVSSMSLWDLQGSWSGWKGLTVSLGVKNLFDRNPPLTNQNLTFQAGYDPNYYDARARVLYTTIRYMFR